MASSSDDTSGGVFNNSSDGSLFGNPDVDGTVNEYSGWTWQQVEAAILGGSMLATSADQTQARTTADPSTLWNAAAMFNDVMDFMQNVVEGLQAYTTLLTGPDSSWQGDAADSFTSMMTSYTGQVTAAVNVLSGGPSGLDSIPVQLMQSGNALSLAQTEIEDLDTYYAQAAINEGAPIMANGLVQISAKPVLVQEMTQQMQQVFQVLYSGYQVTIDSIIAPSSLNNPLDNDNLPDDNLNDLLNNLDDGDGIDNTGGIAPEDLSDLPDTADGDDGIAPDGLSNLPDTAGDGDGIGADDLSDLPNADSGDGIGADDLSDLPDTADGDDGIAPDGLSDLPGTDDGAGDDGIGDDGLGDDGLSDDGVDPDTGLPDISDSGLPDGIGADDGLGADAGLGDGDLAAGDLASVPGLSGLDGEQTGLPGLDDAAVPGQSEAEDGMPMMPGMGGSGMSGAGTGAEPSDASGLLSSDEAPWAGDGTGADMDEVGSPTGTLAGGVGLSGADGMPMMPGMGGSGMSGAGTGAEPSDASGLLSSDEAPWTGEDTGADIGEVDSPSGALAGGVGLSGADGMPMMPGMGGSGMSGAGTGTEPSDASGLLGEEAGEWSGEPTSAEEVGTESGAQPGGPGLDWSAGPSSPVPDQGLSAWDVAGAVGDGFLLALGLWSRRAVDTDGETELDVQTVSSAKKETWTGASAGDGAGFEDGEAEMAAAVWRPDRSASAAPRPRLSLIPAYANDPQETGTQGTDTAQSETEGESAGPDDDPDKPATAADLLVQDARLWGQASADWDLL
jgi:hypothetical protein